MNKEINEEKLSSYTKKEELRGKIVSVPQRF